MNLTEQTVNGTNEIHLQDSLNASLLMFKVKMCADTIAPNNNDLIIYVDKESSSNITEERKEYVFNLLKPLKYFGSVGDELEQEIKVTNNDIVMETKVIRRIGTNLEGLSCVLEMPVIENVETYPVTLFEGINYIYTNYTNSVIELTYPKNTKENKVLLNSAIYYNHKLKNDGEFSIDDIYFKDAFTKSEDKLNLEVNEVTIDCIASKNNKFSLDSEGNLIVNSINGVNQSTNNQDVCNIIYPVGSIYMSANNVNPSALFGGNWDKLKDRFLIGDGDTYQGGSTGGEANHILNVNEMPSHTHAQNPHSHGARAKGFNGTSNTNGYYMLRRNQDGDSYDAIDPASALSNTATNQNTGGSASHNNMPPYLTVYMWKRVS